MFAADKFGLLWHTACDSNSNVLKKISIILLKKIGDIFFISTAVKIWWKLFFLLILYGTGWDIIHSLKLTDNPFLQEHEPKCV